MLMLKRMGAGAASALLVVLALVFAAPAANAITMPLTVYNGDGTNFTAQAEITSTSGGLLLTITNTSDLSSDASGSAIDKVWLESGFGDSFDSASIYGTTGTVVFQQGTVTPGTKPNNFSEIGWTSTWDQGYFTRDGNKDDGINALGYNSQDDSLTLFLAFGSNPSITPLQLYAKILMDDSYSLVAVHANECSPNNSCDAYATPIPATVWLFGSALLGLIGFGSRRRNNAAI